MFKTVSKRTKIWIGVLIAVIIIAVAVIYFFGLKGKLLQGNVSDLPRCDVEGNRSLTNSEERLCKNTQGKVCLQTPKHLFIHVVCGCPYPFIFNPEVGCENISVEWKPGMWRNAFEDLAEHRTASYAYSKDETNPINIGSLDFKWDSRSSPPNVAFGDISITSIKFSIIGLSSREKTNLISIYAEDEKGNRHGNRFEQDGYVSIPINQDLSNSRIGIYLKREGEFEQDEDFYIEIEKPEDIKVEYGVFNKTKFPIRSQEIIIEKNKGTFHAAETGSPAGEIFSRAAPLLESAEPIPAGDILRFEPPLTDLGLTGQQGEPVLASADDETPPEDRTEPAPPPPASPPPENPPEETGQPAPPENNTLTAEAIQITSQTTIDPGAENIELIKFKIKNNSVSPASIKQLKIDRKAKDNSLSTSSMKNFKIFKDNIPIELSMGISNNSTLIFERPGSSAIAQTSSNQELTFSLQVEKISANAPPTKTIQFEITPSSGIVLDASTSNFTIQGEKITGPKYTIGGETAAVTAPPAESATASGQERTAPTEMIGTLSAPASPAIQLSAPDQPASAELQPGQTAEVFKFRLDPIEGTGNISQIKVFLSGTLPREKIQKIQLFEGSDMRSEAAFDRQNLATFSVTRAVNTTVNYIVKVILTNDAPDSDFRISLNASTDIISSDAEVTGGIFQSNQFTVKRPVSQTSQPAQTTQPNAQEIQQLNDRIAQLQREIAAARQSGQADPAIQQQLTSLTQMLLARQNQRTQTASAQTQPSQTQTKAAEKPAKKTSMEELRKAAAERNRERARALTLAREEEARQAQEEAQTARQAQARSALQTQTQIRQAEQTSEIAYHASAATLAGSGRLRQVPESSGSGPGVLVYSIAIALGNAILYLRRRRKNR